MKDIKMNFEASPKSALPKNFRWILVAILAALFFAAAAGVLGPFLAVLALAVITAGIIALIRGKFPVLKITNRSSATSVLLIGVYLLFFGGVVAMNDDGVTPVATAAGDPCDVVGAVQENEVETYYCTPSSSDELVWASEEDFAAYQEAEAKELETQAKEEAEATLKEVEADLTAAEKRADEAEAEVEDYKQQLNEQKEATAKAEEEASTAQAEAERQSQSPQEPTRNAPAPAPAPAQEQSDTGQSTPFANCTEARNAGAAPVHRGDPGYGTHLDRDGDGVGCE